MNMPDTMKHTKERPSTNTSLKQKRQSTNTSLKQKMPSTNTSLKQKNVKHKYISETK